MIRVAAGAAVALIALGIAGAIYESAARAAELGRVSAPGQLVDIGGRKLHIVCMGTASAGQPTVILEAGAGGWSAHWSAFQPVVAPYARVCAYDRAGFGWSDPGPLPRDGARIVSDLHGLLAAAGERGPYVMVGASRGGQYVRLYRDAYPAEVAGLVLIDAEPEDFRAQSELGRAAASQNFIAFSMVGGLTRIGVFRLLGGDPAGAPEIPCIPFMVGIVPASEQAAYAAIEGRPACFDALLAEEAATDQREAQVRQAAPLGDLPLMVLTHGMPAGVPTGASPAQADEVERVWQAAQQRMAGMSSRGVLLRAERSGHNIALDQPELAREAIRQTLKK